MRWICWERKKSIAGKAPIKAAAVFKVGGEFRGLDEQLLLLGDGITEREHRRHVYLSARD